PTQIAPILMRGDIVRVIRTSAFIPERPDAFALNGKAGDNTKGSIGTPWSLLNEIFNIIPRHPTNPSVGFCYFRLAGEAHIRRLQIHNIVTRCVVSERV